MKARFGSWLSSQCCVASFLAQSFGSYWVIQKRKNIGIANQERSWHISLVFCMSYCSQFCTILCSPWLATTSITCNHEALASRVWRCVGQTRIIPGCWLYLPWSYSCLLEWSSIRTVRQGRTWLSWSQLALRKELKTWFFQENHIEWNYWDEYLWINHRPTSSPQWFRRALLCSSWLCSAKKSICRPSSFCCSFLCCV